MQTWSLFLWAALWLNEQGGQPSQGGRLHANGHEVQWALQPNIAQRHGQRSHVSWSAGQHRLSWKRGYMGQGLYGQVLSQDGALQVGLPIQDGKTVNKPALRWLGHTSQGLTFVDWRLGDVLPQSIQWREESWGLGYMRQGGWNMQASNDHGLIQAQFSQQGRFQLKASNAVLSAAFHGRQQWEGSMLSFNKGPVMWQFNESHNPQGMTWSTHGRVKWGNDQVSHHWINSSAGASHSIQWQHRSKAVNWHMHWSTDPWKQAIGLQFIGKHQASINWQPMGFSVRVQQNNLSLMWQQIGGKNLAQMTWNHRMAQSQAHTPLVKVESAANLWLLCSGPVKHPMLPLLLIDQQGRTYRVHVVAQSKQLKTHLPPGMYQVKVPHLMPSGWTYLCSQTSIELVGGKSSHLLLDVKSELPDIRWVSPNE
ncbi:MAG: hypothetical protein HOE88_01530 [Flavobacteriales bacterium]|jgi:hypothetical protein|nr:hypothetical protein [Flavobacteriales bacterium]MBT3572449.1 hypothetical protein [Flavobacteriales bacterium]MBT3678117.1 hypothetical protein [Flavobacteriales bacterium]MBT3740172.1 hypothetical protein [Flavobacteriales bacterium]MBT4102053.1 hypothetical protein [Flavobacteriales bacterium]